MSIFIYRPLGRFIVSLPQCQAASLIEGDFESNKNINIRSLVNKTIK